MLTQKIKEIGQDNDIVATETVRLPEALYRDVDSKGGLQFELYKAVTEVLDTSRTFVCGGDENWQSTCPKWGRTSARRPESHDTMDGAIQLTHRNLTYFDPHHAQKQRWWSGHRENLCLQLKQSQFSYCNDARSSTASIAFFAATQ